MGQLSKRLVIRSYRSIFVGNRPSSDNEIPITASLDATGSVFARPIRRWSKPRPSIQIGNRIPPRFYPHPNPRSRQQRFKFFSRLEFIPPRTSILINRNSYYLEGIIIISSSPRYIEKKGRKKNSSFLDFSMIEISSMMKFAVGIWGWNQLGCCSRQNGPSS